MDEKVKEALKVAKEQEKVHIPTMGELKAEEHYLEEKETMMKRFFKAVKKVVKGKKASEPIKKNVVKKKTVKKNISKKKIIKKSVVKKKVTKKKVSKKKIIKKKGKKKKR